MTTRIVAASIAAALVATPAHAQKWKKDAQDDINAARTLPDREPPSPESVANAHTVCGVFESMQQVRNKCAVVTATRSVVVSISDPMTDVDLREMCNRIPASIALKGLKFEEGWVLNFFAFKGAAISASAKCKL
jgi:hypothetical protein